MSYDIKELMKLPDEEKIAIADLLYSSVNDSDFDKEEYLIEDAEAKYESESAVINDHWKDKDFVAELEKRSEDYKSGKVEGISWEESKANILNSGKKK